MKRISLPLFRERTIDSYFGRNYRKLNAGTAPLTLPRRTLMTHSHSHLSVAALTDILVEHCSFHSNVSVASSTKILREFPPGIASRMILPPLESSFHKGSCGRIAVIGGSSSYAGAPYFAGNAAMLTGSDLAEVFCVGGPNGPASAIRSFSPDLIVHALLPDDASEPTALSKFASALSAERLGSFHAVIVGPGLGRDAATGTAVVQLLSRCAKLPSPPPLVLDGDALWHLSASRCRGALAAAVAAYARTNASIVLTPNVMELRRLAAFFLVPPDAEADEQQRDRSSTLPDPPLVLPIVAEEPHDRMAAAVAPLVLPIFAEEPYDRMAAAVGIARQLGVTVFSKGVTDIVAEASPADATEASVYIVSGAGSRRRVGGQGDVLAGVCGAALGLAGVVQYSRDKNVAHPMNVSAAAAVFASCVLRNAARSAFTDHGRSMLASHLLAYVAPAVQSLDIVVSK